MITPFWGRVSYLLIMSQDRFMLRCKVEGGLPLEELAERGKRCRCSLVRGALKRGMGVIG